LVGIYICLLSKLTLIFFSSLLITFQNTNFIVKVYIHSAYTEKCNSWLWHAVRYKRLRKIRHFFIWFTFVLHNTDCIWLTVLIFLTCIKPKIITFLTEYITFIFFV
jgi:hypothetical protein